MQCNQGLLLYMLGRHGKIFFFNFQKIFQTFSYLIETENSAETSLTTGQLFGYAVLKFFTVFVGSLAIGTAISIITALLFKVSIGGPKVISYHHKKKTAPWYQLSLPTTGFGRLCANSYLEHFSISNPLKSYILGYKRDRTMLHCQENKQVSINLRILRSHKV